MINHKQTTGLAAIVAASIWASSAVAAPPTAFGAFGQYTYDNVTGVITTNPCAAGVSCDPSPITDTGFVQRVVQIGDKTYVQTIIADDTGGVFRSEDWVALNGGNGGIASKQTIDDATDAEATFGTEFELAIGTDFKQGAPEVRIVQNVLGKAGTNSEFFVNNFNYTQPTANVAAGVVTTIAQSVDLDQATAGNQAQSFDYKDVTAAQTATAVFSAAKQVGYTAGDEIAHVLINQPSAGVGTFGFESVTNRTAGGTQSQFSMVTTPGTGWATYDLDPAVDSGADGIGYNDNDATNPWL